MRSLRQGGGKARSRRAVAVLRQVAAFILLAALVYTMPALFGPGFLHGRAREAMGFVLALGDSVRAGMVWAFESIPVR